mmetsp:Transcript_3652/g.9266  ORF Transcript_3652/g.9266 Transcript_3652/m.9266 type:complete len:509 (+) Transcript_3652:53-1579(+)
MIGLLLGSLVLPAAAYNNGAPHSRMPPLGWSSWVALGKGWDTEAASAPEFDFCDEVSVKASIDAFHSVGLYDAGYRHFHLDDCWADRQRNASGFLQAERDHFPNGMKPIVEYAHSKGLTFGLYTCAGTYTCVGKRPGSKGHFAQDANVFAEWGVDVVKMDWCNTQGMEPKDAYAEFSKALNDTGRAMHFNMCEWGKEAPWEWAPMIAQSWRATGDHTGTWESTKSIIAARTKIPRELSGVSYAWNDLDMLETGNYKQAAHANGKLGRMTETEYKTEFSMWAILASPLVVTTPIVNCSSTDQIRGNYTPSSCKPSITDLQKEILFNKEILAINQDVTPAGSLLSPAVEQSAAVLSEACALTTKVSSSSCVENDSYGCVGDGTMWVAKGCRGVFSCSGVTGVHCPPKLEGSRNTTCKCEPPPPVGIQVYARELTGGDMAVVLYNEDEVSDDGGVDFKLLGWPAGTKASVRDLWSHQDLGIFADAFPKTSVEPHGTKVLRLSRQGYLEVVV